MIYGYIRVSSDKQTVENQRKELIDWAAKKGLPIEKWVEETISGTLNYKKGQFKKLVQQTLSSGDVLIVSELSRLSRKLFEIMEILKLLMEKDVRVLTVKEGYELGDNITSKVLAFAFGLSAEIERTLISERTKAGIAKRIELGAVLGRPVGQKGQSVLDKHKEQIFDLLSKNVSKAAIARILGVHRITVAKFIEKQNPSIEKRETNLSARKFDFDRDEIKELILEGNSITALAKIKRASTGGITAYLKRVGLFDLLKETQEAKKIAYNKRKLELGLD